MKLSDGNASKIIRNGNSCHELNETFALGFGNQILKGVDVRHRSVAMTKHGP